MSHRFGDEIVKIARQWIATVGHREKFHYLKMKTVRGIADRFHFEVSHQSDPFRLSFETEGDTGEFYSISFAFGPQGSFLLKLASNGTRNAFGNQLPRVPKIPAFDIDATELRFISFVARFYFCRVIYLLRNKYFHSQEMHGIDFYLLVNVFTTLA